MFIVLGFLLVAVQDPVLAPSPAASAEEPLTAAVIVSDTDVSEEAEGDPFAALTSLGFDEMRDASGGTESYSVDLDTVGLNVATLDGTLENVSLSNTQSGTIDNTLVTDNSGITTVVINSGNGVVLQNSLQVNVYVATGQ